MLRSGHFGLAASLAMGVVVVIVFTMQMSRFEPPLGEKYLYLIEPGGFDFGFPYAGSQDLLAGKSPYASEHQYYPPTYYLLTLPITILFPKDFVSAARVMYWLNLLFFLMLAAVTSRLLARIAAPKVRGFPGYLFFLMALSMSFSGYMALERGQWDTFLSLCMWGGVMATLKRRAAWAIALLSVPCLAKGYTVLLWLGLAGIFVSRGETRQVIKGMLLPFLVLLLPVIHFLPIAWERTKSHLNLLDTDYSNSGFSNLALYLWGPDWATNRYILLSVSIFALLTTYAMAFRVLRDEKASERARAVWLVAFAACSVSTVTAYSSLSYCFNLLFFFPGFLVWVVGQRGIVKELKLSRAGAANFAIVSIVAAACAFKYVVFGIKNFPITAIGVLVGQALIGAVALRQLILSMLSARDRKMLPLSLVKTAEPGLMAVPERSVSGAASSAME